MVSKSLSSFGQQLLIDYAAGNCNKDLLNDVIYAICEIHFTKPKESLAEPEEGEEEYEKTLTEVRAMNETIFYENQNLQRIQSRVRIVETPLPDYNSIDEQCLLTLSNYKDQTEEVNYSSV